MRRATYTILCIPVHCQLKTLRSSASTPRRDSLWLSSMFERERLLGNTTRSIVIQTRTGRDIVNEISPDPTPQQIRERDAIAQRFEGWEMRKPATGGYNCAGHVWAARRTGIFDDFDGQAMTILKDDGYRLLDAGEEPHRGDLVLYWESLNPRKNLHHVGMVFELRPAIHIVGTSSPMPVGLIPWVLSKMDAWSGEFLHPLNHVYFYPDAKYSVEYWTDRPFPRGRTS